MENIFEDAYFGKAYKTKDDTRVIFVRQRYENDFSIYIPKCKYSIETITRYNSKGEFYLGNGEYGHGALDIISEWQEPVDEEKLDELANQMWIQANKDYAITDGTNKSELQQIGFHLGFKAGYRKAKNESTEYRDDIIKKTVYFLDKEGYTLDYYPIDEMVKIVKDNFKKYGLD